MTSRASGILKAVCLFSATVGLAGLATPPAVDEENMEEEANVLMDHFTGSFGCNVPDLSELSPNITASVPRVQIMRAAGAEPMTSGIHTGGATRFTGWVEIENAGSYSFQVAKGSSGSAVLSVNGQQLVATNCGENAPLATADLEAGSHQIVATFIDDGNQDQFALSYQGADTHGKLEVIPARRFQKANVRMEYFTGNMDCKVPDLSGRRPNRVIYIPNVDIKRTAKNNGHIFGIKTGTNWAARFTSLFHVNVGGRYNFMVKKYWADSAALTINGHTVFSAGCKDRSPTGYISLTAGYHKLDLVFSDDGWKDELVLSYQGPDTSGRFQVAQPRQFSEAEWTLAEEGLDCTKACRAVGKKCNEWAVRKVRTAADIRRVASLASYTCTFTTGWAYRNNPGVCTNSKCCLDGSCTGACAYGHIGSTCSGAPAGHWSRLCPCYSH